MPFLRIYERLPEVKKKREEEKRKSEYKSYRLRAQHFKTVSWVDALSMKGWIRPIAEGLEAAWLTLEYSG